MNLAEWRKQRQQGEEFTLPSGLDVFLRRVSLVELAQAGAIPQTLQPAAEDIINRAASLTTIGLDDVKKFGDLATVVAHACLAGPDGLDAEELPWADRMAIFQWANAEGAKFQLFRKEQAGDVETPFTSGQLPPETKRVPRARPS